MVTLTVTLSDAAAARLRDLAAEQNTTPEAVAAAELEAAPAHGYLLRHPAGANGDARPHEGLNGPATAPPADPDDPLIRLLGSIKADVTDVSERHDEYIGQALYDEMRGTPDVR